MSSDMKKMLILSPLISLAMICSCQKQDSAAEAQLAQRKTELDAREELIIQREKAVEEREKVAAEREKALASNRLIPTPRQRPDAAQAEAERQKRIQQLPPELRALIPDRTRVHAERAGINPTTGRPRPVQTQRSAEGAKNPKGTDGALASPAAEVPPADATSPSASATPE